MKIGYARKSFEDPDLLKQVLALKKDGCEKIFCEEQESREERWGQYDACLASLASGDTLVVLSLDRIGKSIQHLSETLEIIHCRGAFFVSLDEKVDTNSPLAETILHLMRAMARFSHEITRERIKTGLAAARSQGRLTGRPRTEMSPEALQLVDTMYLAGGYTYEDIAKAAKLSRTTVYRYLKKYR